MRTLIESGTKPKIQKYKFWEYARQEDYFNFFENGIRPQLFEKERQHHFFLNGRHQFLKM